MNITESNKIKKHKENEEKRESIDKIRTSIGYIKTKTRFGNLKNCVLDLVQSSKKKKKLHKKLFIFCDEFGEIFDYEPLDNEEIMALCKEISEEYRKIDQKFLHYKNKIKNARTNEELENITLEY